MIKQETFNFLLDLKEHNVKEWFDENRSRYQAARKNILDVVDQLIEGIIQFDPSLQGVLAKQTLFRINRDVRFSKNKDPYKTNFGASIVKGGKKSGYSGYYVNIDPVESFVGGGFYMPPSPVLKKIREHIDFNGPQLKAIEEESSFQKEFGGLSEAPSLKTAPKGFEKDHPHIDYLRMKSFTAIRPLPLEVMTSEQMVPSCLQALEAMSPLVHFLNDAIDREG